MIRRNKILYNSSTAGNGEWVRLDSRYETSPERAIQGSVTTGDTITIQGTTIEAKDAAALASVITADDISDLDSFTADFADVLLGNWTFIRAVKTGTTGDAKVQGYV